MDEFLKGHFPPKSFYDYYTKKKGDHLLLYAVIIVLIFIFLGMLIYMNLSFGQHSKAIIESVHDKPSSSGTSSMNEKITDNTGDALSTSSRDKEYHQAYKPLSRPQPGKTLILPQDILKMYGAAK